MRCNNGQRYRTTAPRQKRRAALSRQIKTALGRPAITGRGKAATTMVKRPAKSTTRKPASPKSKPRLLPSDRIAYSPIIDRAPLKLPNGAHMAVWVVINVEEWDSTQPMPRTVITPPAGGAPMPDVPNWAWHEYGNR